MLFRRWTDASSSASDTRWPSSPVILSKLEHIAFQQRSCRMRGSLPAVQSLTAGYADTTGFLALKGLFTSHVTGNFVTLDSALVSGTSGTLGKTLALPTFCLAVLLIRLIAHRLRAAGRPVLRSVLRLQLALLIVAAALAAWAGPFP